MLILGITNDSEVLVKFCHGILKIIANVRKFWLISRYFLVFQVISRLWHIESSWFLHSMLILGIINDFEVLVKFCHGILKIIANVRKFWLISRHFIVFQVISRLWHIESSWFLHSMLILGITNDSEVLVKFCYGILKIIANVHKFWLISRYFLVFQVISRLWHIESSWFLHSTLILGITNDSEVWVKFCHGILKIIANVRKFWPISRYFLVFQVISRLWHIESSWFLHSMLILGITNDSEVLVKFCHGILKIIANVRKF